MVVITGGDLIGLIGVYGYVAIATAVTWLLSHRLSNSRKVLHILTGGIVFFWWAFDTREVMAGLAAFPFVVILLLASPKSPVGPLRRSYLGVSAGEGHPYGLVMYAVSWTIIAYAAFDHILAASIAIGSMSFGDGMGELIGRRFGKIEYMSNRTVEGSLAVFGSVVLTVIVLVWFYCDVVGAASVRPDDTLLFALAVGAFVSCLEAVSPGRLDNLIVPLATGAYLALLGV
ncbi:MAG: phosphatidate cytidylyltransferase [Thermoplasmata archaeon]|nr:phosphatidate cytidylyltransferase [Thermoplasmata archaeon]